MAAKSRDSENRIQKQLQEVVVRAAVGRSIPPIESAISIYLSEGKSKPKEILDTFPEDLGVKVCMFILEHERDEVGGYIVWECQCPQANTAPPPSSSISGVL